MRQRNQTRRLVTAAALTLGWLLGLGGPRAEAQRGRHAAAVPAGRRGPSFSAGAHSRPGSHRTTPGHPGPHRVTPTQPHDAKRQPGLRDSGKKGRPLAHPGDHRMFSRFVDRSRGFGRWHAFRKGQREDLRLQADGRFVRQRRDPRTGRTTATAGTWTLQDSGPGSVELVLAGAAGEEIEVEAVVFGGRGFATGTGPDRVDWSATE